MESPPGKPPTLLAAREPSALLEREGELELVERLLAGAAEGRGSLLLLEGAAGIGKSRLLGAARARAETLGFQVLRARGGELEREFSHGVVRQLYEPPLAAATEEGRARLLAGAGRLAGPLFDFAEPGRGVAADEDASFATLHGLFWLTANLAEQAPAFLAIDDLHWCDAPSLRFLSYLARRLEGLPVVIAASVRTGEPVADAAILAELQSEPLATVVRPAPLGPAAIEQLVRSALERDPVPEFLRAVAASCGGNPLLLNELVQPCSRKGSSRPQAPRPACTR